MRLATVAQVVIPLSSRAIEKRPLHEFWPALVGAAPFVHLADLPTPVEVLHTGSGSDGLWVKRDDRTSRIYGGNKVRTLEVLFAAAKRRGCERIVSTGAYGSNHAVATALHAPRAGLNPGAVLFPQPPSSTAAENLRVLACRASVLVALPHWAWLPFGLLAFARGEQRERRRTFVMVPGGATPLGALGYVSAALELASQVERGELPVPRAIVVGVGSTCTSAGLLLGLSLAAARTDAFRDARGRPAPPKVISVRVTPWPVTSAYRIVGLAVRTSRMLAELSGDRSALRDKRELATGLSVDGRYLGSGYGRVTQDGEAAIARFAELGGPPLDTTYSAKSGAAALDREQAERGPILFWSTKSSAPLPDVPVDLPDSVPGRMRRWLTSEP